VDAIDIWNNLRSQQVFRTPYSLQGHYVARLKQLFPELKYFSVEQIHITASEEEITALALHNYLESLLIYDVLCNFQDGWSKILCKTREIEQRFHRRVGDSFRATR